MIEHCVTSLRIKNEMEIYRAYVTDSLKLIIEQLAKKQGGTVLNKRYIDLIKPPEETPDAREIKARIKKKLGG